MEIVLHGVLPTLNEYIQAERGNRYAGANIKKKATEQVRAQVQGTKEVEHKVNITFEWHTTSRADSDNIVFAKKFILDGLVRGGVLKNDNRRWVGDFKDIIIKDTTDYCLLTLEEASE